jgi:CheY-like chemotaxis protein
MTAYPPSSPLRVLHVDDDHTMRLMTKTALLRSTIPYEVESCASGKEALDKFEAFSPDLLLVDMLMPILDGISLIRKVRVLPNNIGRDIPVVFITGKDNIQIEGRHEIEPVLGVITKPFSPTQLGVDLANLIRNFKETL